MHPEVLEPRSNAAEGSWGLTCGSHRGGLVILDGSLFFLSKQMGANELRRRNLCSEMFREKLLEFGRFLLETYEVSSESFSFCLCGGPAASSSVTSSFVARGQLVADPLPVQSLPLVPIHLKVAQNH